MPHDAHNLRYTTEHTHTPSLSLPLSLSLSLSLSLYPTYIGRLGIHAIPFEASAFGKHRANFREASTLKLCTVYVWFCALG